VSEEILKPSTGFIPLPRRELDFVCQVFEIKAELCTGMPLPSTTTPEGSTIFGTSPPTTTRADSDRAITTDVTNDAGVEENKQRLEESIAQGDVLTASVCFKVLVYDSLFKSYMWNSNNRALLATMVNTEVERTEKEEKLAKEAKEAEESFNQE
jgi:hypothetical protein